MKAIHKTINNIRYRISGTPVHDHQLGWRLAPENAQVSIIHEAALGLSIEEPLTHQGQLEWVLSKLNNAECFLLK